MPRATASAALSAAFVASQLLAPAPATSAKLPRHTHPAKFTSHRVVDGASIGGVKVGMKKAQAIAVWGKPDGPCRRIAPYDPNDRRRGCSYGGFIQTRRGTESARPFATFTVLPSGTVASVHVTLVKLRSSNATLKRQYEMAAARVKAFKTGKGIRLRATMEAARRAYGIPTPTNVPDNLVADYMREVVVRQAGACTVFSSSDSSPAFKYISSISVADAAWCPKDPQPEEPEPQPVE